MDIHTKNRLKKILKPSKCTDLLNSLNGHSIVNVRRYIFESDMSLADHEQSADGSVEITLSDERIIHFLPMTEQFSVGIGVGPMPEWGKSYQLINPSKNDFWSSRINKPIEHISIISSEEEPGIVDEYALHFQLENATFQIEFVDDSSCQDTLRITE